MVNGHNDEAPEHYRVHVVEKMAHGHRHGQRLQSYGPRPAVRWWKGLPDLSPATAFSGHSGVKSTVETPLSPLNAKRIRYWVGTPRARRLSR